MTVLDAVKGIAQGLAVFVGLCCLPTIILPLLYIYLGICWVLDFWYDVRGLNEVVK